MTTRREFLSDVSHRIRFVYLPKHSSWLNQIEIFFGILQRKCPRGGNFTSVPKLESQIQAFIIYYNTTMAHPFNWTYTGKPTKRAAAPISFRPTAALSCNGHTNYQGLYSHETFIPCSGTSHPWRLSDCAHSLVPRSNQRACCKLPKLGPLPDSRH